MRPWLKRALGLICAALTVCIAGCTPSIYTKGVGVGRDYPDDVLPVYKDAVVFEYESDDDEEFELSAGTQARFSKVVGFYEDFFEDEGIVPTVEEDDEEYCAEGVYKGYSFELTVGEPRGQWEEKLYKTVIEIVIEISGEPEVTATPEPTTEPTAEPTPETTQAVDLTGVINLLIRSTWFLQSTTVDGQQTSAMPVSLEFYTDKTGYATYNYQTTSPENAHFSWDVTASAILIYWTGGVSQAVDYTVSEGTLEISYSLDNSQYVEVYSWDAPAIAAGNNLYGAWMVGSGMFTGTMACSFWPDGTGWFWWVNSDGSDTDLRITWYEKSAQTIVFEDEENIFEYQYACDGQYMALADDTDQFDFVRAGGAELNGEWQFSHSLDSQGNEVAASKWGVRFNADGTGYTYALDDAGSATNQLSLVWYINNDGGLTLVEDGQYTTTFWHHVQGEWMMLRDPNESTAYNANWMKRVG
ncbi:MAG: hypothetical protein GX549_08765 [Clostridiales bacterium]|nr:hypothetical protein [Clostridiales bacterium]